MVTMILWIHSLSEYSDKDPSQINMIFLALYNLGLKEFFGHKLHFFSCFSCVRHFATLWTVGHQAPLSMGYSRQEYWESFHTFLQGIFLAQGSNPLLFYLLHWQAGSLPLVPPGKALPQQKVLTLFVDIRVSQPNFLFSIWMLKWVYKT